MKKKYTFAEFSSFQGGNCFTDIYTDMLYFPVENVPDFPEQIRNKVDLIIEKIISKYEQENHCILDMDSLIINARLECYVVPSEERIEHSINITIMSDISYKIDILLSDEYIVLPSDPIYNDFREYFMKQLEKELFKQ